MSDWPGSRGERGEDRSDDRGDLRCATSSADPDGTNGPKLPSMYRTFNWSNPLVWALALPVEDAPLDELAWHLDVPIWSTVQGQRLFDLRPFTVIEAPDTSRWHHERIMRASVEYPLDLLWWDERYVILDGIHRLARLWMTRVDHVRVRRLSRDYIPLIASEEDTDD